MSRVTVAERTKLSVFLVRGALRKLVSRVTGHPLARWPFPSKADRLLIAPQDLRTADATRASEIYAGRFVFAGKVVICDARSPFEITPPSDDWAASLYGFGWLRHLRAAESGITRANARALVDEWITLQANHDPVAWRADVVARRDHRVAVPGAAGARRFRCALLSPLHPEPQPPGAPAPAPGVGRARRPPAPAGVIALTYAALCMAGQSRRIRSATRRLGEELERQILPDGGHISRNPGALIALLIDLLPLRTAFSARNIPPPAALLNAIDRMMPMLRFFRHGDGNFALFNGMGPTPTDLLTTILAYDDARGQPLSNAPHSGYQRLEAGGAVLIMDAGVPPPLAVSQEAHAGTLVFEFSSKFTRIIVNCGLPATSRESWRQVARATAAHSTVTFNDESSSRIVESGSLKRMLQGMPIVGGPHEVAVEREEKDGAAVLRTVA